MTEAPSPARTGDLRVYARLLGYVRPHWIAFVVSNLGFAAQSSATVAFAELLDRTVDAIQTADADARTLLPLAMVAVVLVRAAGAFVGEWFLGGVAHRVVHVLRCELFDQLLRLPASYLERARQGHLVSRLTFNVSQVRDATTEAAQTLAEEGFTVIGLLGFPFWKNWKLTLVFLLAAPLIAWVVRSASRRFRRIAHRIQGSMGDVTQSASETVGAYRVVRAFGGEAAESRRFHSASERNRRQNLRMIATKLASTQSIQVIIACVLSLLIWLALDPVLLAGMDAGGVVAFVTAAGLMAKPIRKLSEVNARLQRGLAAAEDLFAQLDHPLEPDTGRRRLSDVRGEIEFRDVRFTYPGSDRAALDGISLTIGAGETVALVGPSGGGKSTIAGMIGRFHDPESGAILLDGVPLAEYRLADLRARIALVTQNVVLFHDTVARNIAYGAMEGAEPAAIRAAAERAHARAFIEELEHGFDTVVGDAGVRLSGGQRQRIAIARAILKDAPILILDEATSALDNESERHVQAALDAARAGRTTLVIAHRLSTVERADRIVVVDRGRVLETGTHAELIGAGGAYARLHAEGRAAGDRIGAPAAGDDHHGRHDARPEAQDTGPRDGGTGATGIT